jgi:hypothetical protein
MFRMHATGKQQNSRPGRRSVRALAVTALLAGIAFTPLAAADWYFGAKAGSMMIDVGGMDDPSNAGVMVGHEWGVVLGDIGVQGEITSSIDDGSYAGQDVSIDTQAVYGVFRTAGPVYFIAKLGMLREDVTIGSVSDDDTGSSAGLGVGFSIGLAQFEVEYTQIEDDVDFLSVGFRF